MQMKVFSNLWVVWVWRPCLTWDAQQMSPTDNEKGDIPFVKQDPGGPQCLITYGLIKMEMVMEVITLRDPPVGGQAGPHSADKTKDKIREEWK